MRKPLNNANVSPNASLAALTRRDFAARFAAFLPVLGFGSGLGLANTAEAAALAPTEEISHSSEAIHQEVTFNATPARVYNALIDAKQFNKVVLLSAAMKGMSGKPVEMSQQPGGAFAAFGGYVTGRQIELVPGQRIVQAWRAGGWPAGVYSIASFELSAEGSGTKLVFNHTGFPQGQAEHLLEGWKSNYWGPLEKYLAQSQ